MIVSDRALSVPASEIRRMFNLAQGVQGLIDLSIGAPDFETPAHIVEEAVAATRGGHHYYSPNAGLPELRRAIAAKLERENGVSFDPLTEIDVTIGATEALGLLMMTLVNPGDEVIVIEPIWPNYLTQIIMAGGVPVRVQTNEEDGFRPRPEAVEAAITPRTRVVMICTPNNPTGAVMSRESVTAVADVARRNNLYLISDEVYEKIIYDGNQHFSAASLPGAREFVITVNSFSKSYAMCGWRVGYVAARSEVIAPLLKLQEGMASCANTMAQKAAVVALTGPQDSVSQMVEAYRVRRDLMVDGLHRIPGLSVVRPGGAFYLFVNIKQLGKSSLDVAMDLLQKGRVMTVPGPGFGLSGEGYLRLCYARDESVLQEALERIHQVVVSECSLT